MQHIWIFQLEKPLEAAEKASVEAGLGRLIGEWKAHGTPVPGKAEVRYDRFVIVRATPGTTSGCSVDSMTHGVEALLKEVGATPMPNNFVCFREADGSVACLDFRDFPEALASGRITGDTVVFDNTLGQTQDILRWEVRLADCWLSRYLPKKV